MKKDTIVSRLKQYARNPAAMWLALVAGLGIYVWNALRTIRDASIWFDEAFSAYITRFNFVDIVKYTAADVHPPLYYWALKLWEMLFGTSDLAIRSLSVLFGCVAIVFAFLLVKRLFGKKAALISLLFMALLPMLVRYGQEARMYTMMAAIAFGATYALVCANETKKRLHWIIYGLLVSAGMWTHYFMILVWFAHWAWQASRLWDQKLRGKKLIRQLFSGKWWRTYLLAIVLFLPWLPFMIKQLTIVQAAGFWIGPVGLDSLTNVVSNFFLYQEHDKVQSWLAVLLIIITAGSVFYIIKTYRSMEAKPKSYYQLILCLALVPMVLLFISSLPPLRSSFVERYLLPSFIALALVAAIAIAYNWNNDKRCYLLVLMIAGAMIAGIYNVEYYGNYNKNSNTAVDTKQLVLDVRAAGADNQPIIAATPWIYYEAVFYDTATSPVYFIDAQTSYNYGSLEMLKDNNFHKITDLDQFASQHSIVWYIGQSGSDDMQTPVDDWQVLQTIYLNDRMTGQSAYEAVQYRTNVE